MKFIVFSINRLIDLGARYEIKGSYPDGRIVIRIIVPPLRQGNSVSSSEWEAVITYEDLERTNTKWLEGGLCSEIRDLILHISDRIKIVKKHVEVHFEG